jgi:hypothetical protein
MRRQKAIRTRLIRALAADPVRMLPPATSTVGRLLAALAAAPISDPVNVDIRSATRSGSGFAAAQSHPEGDPHVDGPTERLFDSQAPDGMPSTRLGPNRRGVLVAVSLSGLALVASVGAGLVAWRSLARVDAPAPSSLATAPAHPATRGTDPPSPQRSAGYTITYAQESLRIQIGCSAVMFLDLDELRADADEQGSDLRYDSRCGTEAPSLSLGPGAQAGGQVTDSDTDASGCDNAIRTSPLGRGARVPVKKGTVLCVLTSAADAVARVELPRMVLVEITEVTDDGIANMRATSWTVPE